MRRVLIVAYHFPPAGGAGVQRTVKFAKYLPEFGYEPTILTGPISDHGRLSDTSLAREVGSSVDVIRIEGPEPPLSEGWRRRAERWHFTPEPWAGWWTGSVEAAVRAIGADFDIICASMSPYESAPACAAAAADLGLPWVADLRDPWALDEVEVYPTRLHHRRDLMAMRSALRAASAVVMNTPEAHRRVLACFPELAGKPIMSIANGFDRADFAGRPPVRDDDAFRIVHSGHFLSDLGDRHRRTRMLRRMLGGAHADLELMTRSPIFLVHALRHAVQADPRLAKAIELHLAGALSERERQLLAGCPVRVVQHGYMEHAAAVALVRSADLLFLPMHTPPPGARATRVPAKLYEYLAAGRPVLAAVPDGDARDILARVGGAMLSRPDDAVRMAELIAGEVARHAAGRPPRPPDPDIVAEFERRHLTARLAGAFDQVLKGKDSL